ncbi:hypothetical protein [Streptomyces sp. CL12-4]|uniref:hypothetical protein n=1 Tax=Streptomyces sp. CL12-4 TaxID=2810306 RepID=UPI001EFC0BC5|nr:hypothetical protein [Streptomyces sp. CL12-4]MCG8971314.1 hypothetical protein [Streptomyces sp. CL12-4]
MEGWLDVRLADQHGGHAPGTRVRFGDGRPAVVRKDGPSVAYPLDPIQTGQQAASR